MRVIPLVIFFVCMFVGACTERTQKQEVVQLQKQVEDVHDDAMKLLADMNRVSRTLKSASEDSTIALTRKDSILDVLTNMKKAEEDMYAWMTNYKAPTAEAAHQEARSYLEGQKVLIEQNRSDIKAAVMAGQAMITTK